MTPAALLAHRGMRVILVEHALALFVMRRRERVAATQHDSRQLARLVFVKSAALRHMRDLLMQFCWPKRLAASVAQAFDEPI